jgi:hypothetical protein
MRGGTTKYDSVILILYTLGKLLLNITQNPRFYPHPCVFIGIHTIHLRFQIIWLATASCKGRHLHMIQNARFQKSDWQHQELNPFNRY